MASVNALIDRLLDSPSGTVAEAGEHLLATLSGNTLTPAAFLDDPLVLVGPPYFSSRYIAQVVLRALKAEYDTVDEVLSSLAALIDRNPPILEARRQPIDNRVVLPEAKVLDL